MKVTENKKLEALAKEQEAKAHAEAEARKAKSLKDIQFLGNMLNHANTRGAFTLEQSTNIGLILNDFINKFK